MMNRRTARELALRLLYGMDLTDASADSVMDSLNAENFTSLRAEDELYRELPDDAQRGYIDRLIHEVGAHREEFDGIIGKYAIGWKTERISRVTRCILRLSLCELVRMDGSDIPPASSINEAVELCKKYDSQDAASFVNGILGSFMRARKSESASSESSESEPTAAESAKV